MESQKEMPSEVGTRGARQERLPYMTSVVSGVGIEHVNPSHHSHKTRMLLPILYDGELDQLISGGNSRLYVPFIGPVYFLT